MERRKKRLVIDGPGHAPTDSKRGTGGWEQIGASQIPQYIDARSPLVPGQPSFANTVARGC